MKRTLPVLLLVALVLAVGCQKKEAAEPAPGTPEGAKAAGAANTPAPGGSPTGAAPPSSGGGGSSVNVTPIGGVGAGPMTPVTGAENIQGGGSGAGQVMKERAKGIAGQSPSSVNQMGDD